MPSKEPMSMISYAGNFDCSSHDLQCPVSGVIACFISQYWPHSAASPKEP